MVSPRVVGVLVRAAEVRAARGRQVVQRAIPRHGRDVSALMSALPARDLVQLRGALGRLNRALEVTCHARSRPSSRHGETGG